MVSEADRLRAENAKLGRLLGLLTAVARDLIRERKIRR